MAKKPWPAAPDVVQLMEHVKAKHHPLLIDATVALAFIDAKPFTKNRFNWGKASKFSSLNQLWQAKEQKYIYQILLPADGWYQVLAGVQREAWLDLHLTRFHPEMIAAFDEGPEAGEGEEAAAKKKKGKPKPKKDKFGRIVYTNDVKLDEETGEPLWKVDPLDLHVFAVNAKRYGLWCEDLQLIGDAVGGAEAPQADLFCNGKGIVPNAECSFKPAQTDLEQLEDGEGDGAFQYHQKLKD